MTFLSSPSSPTDPNSYGLCLLPPCRPSFPSQSSAVCFAAGLTSALSAPSPVAEPLLRLSCLFWRGSLLRRTGADTLCLWAPLAVQREGAESHAGVQPALSAVSSPVFHVRWRVDGAENLGTAFASSLGALVLAMRRDPGQLRALPGNQRVRCCVHKSV